MLRLSTLVVEVRSCTYLADRADFVLHFQRPPTQHGDRWSRQRRSYITVHPPYSALDTVAIRKDKSRFLENLWTAQCKARKARALVSHDYDIGYDRVRCYWSTFDSAPLPVCSKIRCV